MISETSIQFQWEPSAVIGEGTFGKVFLGRSVAVVAVPMYDPLSYESSYLPLSFQERVYGRVSSSEATVPGGWFRPGGGEHPEGNKGHVEAGSPKHSQVLHYLLHSFSIDLFVVNEVPALVLNWPDIWAPPRPSATSIFCWSMWLAGRWLTCSRAARSQSLSYSKLPLSESSYSFLSQQYICMFCSHHTYTVVGTSCQADILYFFSRLCGCREYGMDIVSGVCYLHQMGILHSKLPLL